MKQSVLPRDQRASKETVHRAKRCSKDLKEKAKRLPELPGVYLMKDAQNRIIYIGKARSLRNRVRSYFQQTAQFPPRTAALGANMVDFDFLVTDSEVEALILEANLIKAYKPRYNVNLKDDKKFPFIKLTNERFPQLLITRRLEKDGARYFGPYTDVRAIRRTLTTISKLFRLRTCTPSAFTMYKGRGCLDYYIDRCIGPCLVQVSPEQYQEVVAAVCQFLTGKTTALLQQLQERMLQASAQLKFEEAARIRDQIRDIEKIVARQKVVDALPVDRDAVGFARNGKEVCALVLQVRDGRLIGKDHFFLEGAAGADDQELVASFVAQYYLAGRFIPDELCLPIRLEDQELVAQWLRERKGRRVNFLIPQRGDKVRLVRMAERNAALVLQEQLEKKSHYRDQVPAAVVLLQQDLRLERTPRLIEAFDISNIQGTDAVAAMVCFRDGKPYRSRYRKFKIKTVAGPNDYAMMAEAVRRRYQQVLEEEQELPDLILIDGGKGQLSSAVEVLHALDLADQAIIALAKRLEEVFLPARAEPLVIPRTSPSLRLLQRIRDEVHRFALSFHRQVRSKRTVASELDRIPGIGPGRKQCLLKSLGSLKRIKTCSVEELAQVKGISPKLAHQIYTHLHPASKK